MAATVFPLRLEGQMRAIQRPSTPARISAGPPFRSAQPHSIGSGVTSPGGFVRRPGFVGSVGFRRHQRFHIFFGNACFSDPFFCRQFFFRNRFFFAQPVFFSLGPQPKRRRPPRFWFFVTVVGAKSRITRLSDRHCGCSRNSGHGRCRYSISMWKLQGS